MIYQVCCFEIEDVITVTFCEFDIDDTFPLSKAYPQKKFEYVLFRDGFKVKELV